MTVLCDDEIRRRLDEDDDFVFEPMEREDLQIQPSSIDMRLGRDVKRYDPDVTYITPDMPVDGVMFDKHYENDEGIPVHPRDFLLIPTQEWIELPADVQGQVTGRSSLGRLGIEVHSTAGLIDPGFKGQILLEVSNNSNTTVELKPGMRIAQLVLHQMEQPASEPYGARGDSKYQRQTGAEESHLNEDPDL